MRLSFLVRAILVPILSVVALIVLIRPNPYPHAIVWLFVAAFVLFADLASVLRGHLQNACVVVATLAFGLAGIEAFAEARMPHEVVSHLDLYVHDADLGYHAARPGPYAASKSVDGKQAYSVTYTIDDHLRRLTHSPADGPKVRFFGDSYTFGEGLDDADTLPQVFAGLTGANVENYGYPGFSPAQALRALELGLFDKDLAGSRLFVLQTAPFHIERTSCTPSWTDGFPRYVTVDGVLKREGYCRPSPGQSSGIYRMFLQGQDQKIRPADIENYVNVVDAFVRLAKQKYGADVLILDMANDADELKGGAVTSKAIEARFRQAGALVIDDAVSQRGGVLKIPYDGHPSAIADRLYAHKLVDTLRKERPGLLAARATADTAIAEQPAPQ